MRAPARLWRTSDGRLVPDGHPDAAVLAYAPGDELAETDAALVKAADKTADKMAARPADKAHRRAAGTHDRT